MAGQTLVAQRRKVIAQMSKEGASCTVIARHLGISSTRVSQVRTELGYKQRNARITEEQVEEIARLAQCGVSSTEIGKRVGVSPTTVLTYLRTADHITFTCGRCGIGLKSTREVGWCRDCQAVDPEIYKAHGYLTNTPIN